MQPKNITEPFHEPITRLFPSEYHSWHHMKQRCLDTNHPQYRHYGGRGITIHGPWINSFHAFLKDMGPKPTLKHTIERKDNNLGYSPDNCKWATYIEQNRNTRSNRWVTINGVTQTVAAWAEFSGISQQVLHYRLRKGVNSDSLLEPYVSLRTNGRLDITGQTFGFLTAIRYVDSHPETRWLWQCACGVEFVARYRVVVHGRTRSCGCRTSRRPRTVTASRSS